jgi:HNH endonuclease
MATRRYGPIAVYRPVPGFPGYRVGNDGSVWSCWIRSARRARLMSDQWHRLKPTRVSKYGHLQVALTRNGKKYTKQLGALVLEAFVGPRPEGMECCHFPERDPTNCTLPNLRWGTRQENMRDAIYQGTIFGLHCKGEKNTNCKVTEDDVREIRAAQGRGAVARLAKKFGVSRQTIISIRMGRTWRHVL